MDKFVIVTGEKYREPYLKFKSFDYLGLFKVVREIDNKVVVLDCFDEGDEVLFEKEDVTEIPSERFDEFYELYDTPMTGVEFTERMEELLKTLKPSEKETENNG